MPNALTRSQPCPECGADLMWTQNAWQTEGASCAAYRCVNGHVIDPLATRQCPKCGVHDTAIVSDADGRQRFVCAQCGESFAHPR